MAPHSFNLFKAPADAVSLLALRVGALSSFEAPVFGVLSFHFFVFLFFSSAHATHRRETREGALRVNRRWPRCGPRSSQGCASAGAAPARQLFGISSRFKVLEIQCESRSRTRKMAHSTRLVWLFPSTLGSDPNIGPERERSLCDVRRWEKYLSSAGFQALGERRTSAALAPSRASRRVAARAARGRALRG